MKVIFVLLTINLIISIQITQIHFKTHLKKSNIYINKQTYILVYNYKKFCLQNLKSSIKQVKKFLQQMDKLLSFWRSSSSQSQQQKSQIKQQSSSIFQQASSYISSYRKQNIPLSVSQFDQYLDSIPEEYKKFKNNYQQKKSTTYHSLKPQLVKKVYEKVQTLYFAAVFQIKPQFFEKNKKVNIEKQHRLHQSLDQVQIALFNQITTRFDQILSVLRTVQSLHCLVDYNINRIRNIRTNNFAVANNVAHKQIKIVKSIQKKKNLQQSIKYLQKLKRYAQFLKKQQISSSLKIKPQERQSTSQIYESIQSIKKQVSFLSKLRCCQRLDVQIQTSQQDLKKSFSQTLNQLIFQYTVGKISPYRKSYWDKFKHRFDILQSEEKPSHDGTMLLDQSTMIEDDFGGNQQVKLSLHQENQEIILKNIMRGWNEGEYAVGGLKLIIQKHIKTTHSNFMNDFRQFCQNYLKNRQRQVSNPCLQQLIEQFTLGFFSKCCTFYSTLFQNLLYRLSSVTTVSLNYIIKTSIQQNENILTIEQKQKLTQMMDGIGNVFIFVWKSIIDKFTELLENKQIIQSNDISDFKSFITVIENMQEFLNTKIQNKLQTVVCPNSSFLYEKFIQIKQSFLKLQVASFKKAKLLEFLSKMHKNAIQIQMKQSLQTEIWTPTDIPTFYYDSLHFIITGESLNLRRNKGIRSTTTSTTMGNGNTFVYDTSVLMQSMIKEQSYLLDKKPQMSSNFRIIRTQILIGTQNFKITQTVLLLMQIIQDYMLLNQFYPQIQQQIASRISQIFRSYNASSLQLIVHAGAVVLGKIKTKSITAKHLALSTLCLRFCIFVLECIKKRIVLKDLQKLLKDLQDHAQTTTRKLETILKSKINQSVNQIKLQTSPTKGTQAIVNSCKIMHDILIDFFDQKTLKKIFIKQIFTQYITKISTLKIQNKVNAQSLKDDVNFFFNQLKFLSTLIQGFQQYRIQAEHIVRVAFQGL